MPPCDCSKLEIINSIHSRLDKLETKMDVVEKTLSKLLWGIFGTLATSVMTLLIILLQISSDK
jgi:tetrahydromethanopterin S-methyltransferase subunit G